MSHLTSHHLYPPFPSGIETAPLVSISLSRLQSKDRTESQSLFDSCCQLGFFYLDLEGSEVGESLISGAEKLNEIQKAFFKLKKEEKDEYKLGKFDKFFAYRPMDTVFKDDDGLPKRNESYNIRKDDILDNCDPLPVHPLIWSQKAVLKQYTLDCRLITDLLLELLERHLKLPSGALKDLHRINHLSGDHVRFTQSASSIPFNEDRARHSEHTDFGSLTILFNWLGGLQIRLPENEKWVYVKPIPAKCIVNLGDALVLFTAGILRSNIHRVVPPPSPQDGFVRNSLVFFSRPENKVILRRLKGGIIDDQPEEQKVGEGMTSEEWVLRRSLGDLRGVFTHQKGLEARKLVNAV